jgi:hypothetical protein
MPDPQKSGRGLEGCRSPKPSEPLSRTCGACVLDCGSPLPLFPGVRLATDIFNRTPFCARIWEKDMSSLLL